MFCNGFISLKVSPSISKNHEKMQMMYVDKARNVNIGGRDLKTDVSPFDHDDHYRHHNILMDYYHQVQIQRRREQLRGKQDAAEEKDYITFLQQVDQDDQNDDDNMI